MFVCVGPADYLQSGRARESTLTAVAVSNLKQSHNEIKAQFSALRGALIA